MLKSYLSSIKSKLPTYSTSLVYNKMKELNDDQLHYVTLTKLKNPYIALAFSLLFGGLGIDRFYIGDSKRGRTKLLLSNATLFIWVCMALSIFFLTLGFPIIGILVLIVAIDLLSLTVAYTAYDWFIIVRDTRQINLKKILSSIQKSKNKM